MTELDRNWTLERDETTGRLVLVDPDSPTPWRVWVEPTLADILSVVEANS